MDYVGSKTRSLGQNLEKPCVCSRDQIFGLILMKLGQSFLKKLQESMDRCTGSCDITEILLGTAYIINQSKLGKIS